MTKKTKYFLWSILIFIANTRYVNSMEQKEKDEEIMKALLTITPPLPTEIAKIIVMYKNNIKEEPKEPAYQYYQNLPSRAGSLFHHYKEINVLIPNNDKNEPIVYPFS